MGSGGGGVDILARQTSDAVVGLEEFDADGALVQTPGEQWIHLVEVLHRQLFQRLLRGCSEFALKKKNQFPGNILGFTNI